MFEGLAQQGQFVADASEQSLIATLALLIVEHASDLFFAHRSPQIFEAGLNGGVRVMRRELKRDAELVEGLETAELHGEGQTAAQRAHVLGVEVEFEALNLAQEIAHSATVDGEFGELINELSVTAYLLE